MEKIFERHDKIFYRDGDKLIKKFDQSYSKSDVLNEALNQARVAETGLNIPRIHDVELSDGGAAIVMDFVVGDTVESLMKKYPEKKEELLRLFVDVQRQIHQKRHLLLTKFADKLKMKIMQSNLSASTRYDLSMRVDGMPRHTHVCHGDYNPSNVILTKDGTPFILDWSHASQGNATADGVKSYFLLRLSGENELAEQYMALICRSLEVDEVYFRRWMPLVAAAQLIKATGAQRKFFMEWIEEENG